MRYSLRISLLKLFIQNYTLRLQKSPSAFNASLVCVISTLHLTLCTNVLNEIQVQVQTHVGSENIIINNFSGNRLHRHRSCSQIVNRELQLVIQHEELKIHVRALEVGLGGLGVTCSLRDPRFARSTPTEIDGFFSGRKNPEKNHLGRTLSWGSRV